MLFEHVVENVMNVVNKKRSVYEGMSFKSIPFKIDMKLLIK